jgi:hypothetical protein
MSLGTCLTDLHARGVVSDARYERLRPDYEGLVAQYERAYGRAAAESMATQKVLATAELDALTRKRQVLLQAQAQGEWLARRQLDARPSGAFNAKAAHDEVVAMDYHRIAVRRQAHGMIEGLLARFRHDGLGRVRDKAGVLDVLRELHGEDSGNLSAKELADAWRQTAEWLRGRFNAAGGHIAKLDSWALPQTHDSLRVMDAGFEGWRSFAEPLLDRGKMLDRQSGLPLNDGQLELVLREAWQTIASDGRSGREPGGVGAGSVANRRAAHRVLHFAGADAWQAYAERFGNTGSAFDAMLAHVEGMSRDIAAMERMGPNPTASLRFQQDWLDKSAHDAMDAPAIDRVQGGVKQLGRLYDEFSGANNAPENRVLARRFAIFRSLQSAAKLGGAALSSGGDFGTTLLTAGFDGLPPGKIMARYVKMLNPANLEDRRLAARLGAVSDEWGHMLASAERMTGEAFGGEVTRRVAQFVMTASGLALHTESARMAFGLEMMSTLTHVRGHAYGNLDGGFQRMLGRYGIDEAKWDALRATELVEQRGAEWIMPEKIADQDIADRVVRMIATESDHAVPMPDLRTRTSINANAPRGTWKGELMRSAFLFKGFPLSVINLHGRRLLEQQTIGGKAGYGLALVLLTTAGGALSLQAKAIAKGQDPQDMRTARFWGAAALQGGGLGIFGDLLGATQNRFGGGVAQTLAGPGAQFGDEVLALPGDALHAIKGEDTHFGRDTVNLLSHETPGVSLWYARLALDRLLLDTAKQWADGDGYDASLQRLNRAAAEQDTGYFAPPGGGLDWRAPDFGNAIGRPSAVENQQRQ